MDRAACKGQKHAVQTQNWEPIALQIVRPCGADCGVKTRLDAARILPADASRRLGRSSAGAMNEGAAKSAYI